MIGTAILVIFLTIIFIVLLKELIPFLTYLAYYKKQGIRYCYFPILGYVKLISSVLHTKDLMSNYRTFFEKEYKDEDLVAVNRFKHTRVTLMILNPKLTRDFYAKEMDFCKKIDEYDYPLNFGFLHKNGPEALERRAIFGEFFKPYNLEKIAPGVYDIIDRHIQKLRADVEELQTGGEEFVEVDLREYFPGLFGDLVNTILFGGDDFPTVDGMTVPSAIDQISTKASILFRSPKNTLTFGQLHKHRILKESQELVRASDRVGAQLAKFVEKRQEKKEEELGVNLVELMLKYNLKNEKKLTMKEMVDNISLFQLAGQDTTKNSCESFFKIISQKPETCSRIYEEIVQGHFKSEEDCRLLENYEKSEYLIALWDELMRFQGPSPVAIPRLTVRDYKIGRYTIKKGTLVTLPMMAFHFNEAFFKDPYTFDETRFQGENRKKMDKSAYIPFLSGKRSCIGRYLAQMLQRMITVAIFKNFEMKSTGKEMRLGLRFVVGVQKCDVLLRPRQR